MTTWDPSIDRDDHLPEGPPNETFSERLRRLAREIHGTPDDVTKLTPQEIAHRARTEPPQEERLDEIFRDDPGQEG